MISPIQPTRIGVFFLLTVLASPALAQFDKNVPAPPPQLVARGKEVFTKRCVRCHGLDGDGRGPDFAQLDPKPRDLRRGQYKFRSTALGNVPRDEDLARTITRGLPGTAMVGVAMHVDDLNALVAYLKTLHMPGRSSRFRREEPGPALVIPETPKLTWERAYRGQQLFRIFRCWRCHGPAARGDGPISARLRDEIGNFALPADLTQRPFKAGEAPEDLYRLILTGMNYTPMVAWPALRLGLLPYRPDADYAILGAKAIAEMRAWVKKQPFISPGPETYKLAVQTGADRGWDLVAFIYAMRTTHVNRLGPPGKPFAPNSP